MAYVLYRGSQRERLVLHEFMITGWLPKDVGCRTCRREILGFIPVFTRQAADIPAGQHKGLGKAGYQCGQGLWSLNLSASNRPRR
ncbi:hypothetical protein D3C84_1222000 [compost metagenome]